MCKACWQIVFLYGVEQLKRFPRIFILVFLTAATLLSAQASAAVNAVTTASVNMRAGPVVQYAIVAVVPAGQRIKVFGYLTRQLANHAALTSRHCSPAETDPDCAVATVLDGSVWQIAVANGHLDCMTRPWAFGIATRSRPNFDGSAPVFPWTLMAQAVFRTTRHFLISDPFDCDNCVA